ncbi:MAG: ABC transporter substrate-binding protein [Chloroflexota bacterium]|nr:ABC transporter substrate-binding protein [Chloroflexota bacterium]
MRRRQFLGSSAALAASVVGLGIGAGCATAPTGSGSNAVLGPPETTTLRMSGGGACDAAFWTAGDYLREEGFTDARILPPSIGAVQRGEADIAVGYSQWIVANVDAGQPLLALGGMHTGCAELWVRPGIASIRDLKGKTIAVNATDVTDVVYGFWSAILASVGFDPRTQVNFVARGATASTLDLFVQGESDALLALAVQVPLLRANPKNPGTLVMANVEDKPWSQYYCCQLIANRDWVQRYPMAAKRVTRALLRANDRVAKDPAAAALSGVTQGFFTNYESVLAVLKNGRYEWRDLDPEESLRFFALQLADQKMVKGVPQQLVAQSSDYAYMRALKTQLPRPTN